MLQVMRQMVALLMPLDHYYLIPLIPGLGLDTLATDAHGASKCPPSVMRKRADYT